MTLFFATYWTISAIISAIIALIITIISLKRTPDNDIGSVLYHILLTIGCFLTGLAIAFVTCYSFSHIKESKPTWKTIYPNDQNVTISFDNRYLDKP